MRKGAWALEDNLALREGGGLRMLSPGASLNMTDPCIWNRICVGITYNPFNCVFRYLPDDSNGLLSSFDKKAPLYCHLHVQPRTVSIHWNGARYSHKL